MIGSVINLLLLSYGPDNIWSEVGKSVVRAKKKNRNSSCTCRILPATGADVLLLFRYRFSKPIITLRFVLNGNINLEVFIFWYIPNE